MAVSPRSQMIRSWIPAAILVVIIAGIVFTTIAVQNSWWAQDEPVASADQRAPDGASMLSDAGLDYVNVEGVLRVRIGEGALASTALGLRADEEKTSPFRRPVRAIVAAGEDTWIVNDVESLSLIAQNDRLASVTLDVGQALPWSGAVATVQGLADDFGWSQSEIASWEAEISAFTRDHTEGAYTATVTSTDAAQVTGTLVFDRGSGYTSLTITFDAVE